MDYVESLLQDLNLRSQGPNVSLSTYIRVIMDYYERGRTALTEQDVINRVLRQMHPEYKQALQGKVIQILAQLKRTAHEAQELLTSMRTYKPPPTSGSLEPSLAWKFSHRARDYANEEAHAATQVGMDRPAPGLQMSSVDPYTFYHSNTLKKSCSLSMYTCR